MGGSQLAPGGWGLSWVVAPQGGEVPCSARSHPQAAHRKGAPGAPRALPPAPSSPARLTLARGPAAALRSLCPGTEARPCPHAGGPQCPRGGGLEGIMGHLNLSPCTSDPTRAPRGRSQHCSALVPGPPISSKQRESQVLRQLLDPGGVLRVSPSPQNQASPPPRTQRRASRLHPVLRPSGPPAQAILKLRHPC